MFNLVRTVTRLSSRCVHKQRRTFLSEAYYCKEVWQQRFQDPIVKKVNLDELYNELDQKYNKYKNISAIDVDIFANAINDISYSDELLDIIHKLRLSADSSNTLNSTLHAVVRNLLEYGKTDELLMVLDDRLNYGIFLDHYITNLLLDTFWKHKDYASGARVASQLMLQEDFEHPLCKALSLLHCFNYLLNPTEWPQPSKPEEPEEEVKIRVRFLRTPYDDRHFDLQEPLQIVGKTIMMITKNQQNLLEKSLHLVGVSLFETPNETQKLISTLVNNNEPIYEDALKLVPKDFDTQAIKTQQGDLHTLLQEQIKLVIEKTVEKDIALQCDTYLQWEKDRKAALDKQQERLLTAKRLADIEELQQKLKEKETLLWYFQNEEKIELQIDEKNAILAKATKDSKMPITTEEVYIPPEVHKKYNDLKK